MPCGANAAGRRPVSKWSTRLAHIFSKSAGGAAREDGSLAAEEEGLERVARVGVAGRAHDFEQEVTAYLLLASSGSEAAAIRFLADVCRR
eukprot:CAMPEP_0184225208 /NCGR_PEP_ID=MMETSP0976-20121227/20128_1 /TAXON_ID=483370 /ORGANISM="non described non described, Strain CCMP2097" /LENGTH=89 /DNA_ID=CAMNT_0026530139 /DNA_START=8 /DNA_END=274 /DNA_ORIENTATION=-